jgi:hypothetical protein
VVYYLTALDSNRIVNSILGGDLSIWDLKTKEKVKNIRNDNARYIMNIINYNAK